MPDEPEAPETVDNSTGNESDPPETLDTGSEAPETGSEAPEVGSEEPGDPYESYGGKDRIEAAIRLHEAASTDEGVIKLFFEAGRSLGLGLKDIEALFGSQNPDAEAEDLDRPMTAKDFQDYLTKQQTERASQGRKDAEAIARQAVATTMAELKIAQGSDTARMVLEMGDKYLKNNALDAESVSNAVRRGNADYQAFVEKAAQDYLSRKKSQGDKVPGAPSGASAPAAPPPAEPKNVAEAILLARKRYLVAD